jgi:hypothetical protein
LVDRADERSDRCWTLREPRRVHDHNAVMIATSGSVFAIEREEITAVVGDDRPLLALRRREKVGVRESAQLGSFLDSTGVGSALA